MRFPTDTIELPPAEIANIGMPSEGPERSKHANLSAGAGANADVVRPELPVATVAGRRQAGGLAGVAAALVEQPHAVAGGVALLPVRLRAELPLQLHLLHSDTISGHVLQD